MNAVIDRLVQYPNRFQLTNISDGAVLGTFDLSPVTGTVSVVGTILNHDLFQSIADDLATRVKTSGGVVSDTTETFTMAGTRTNVVSGETISVSFGKIAKVINDLKAVAFSGDKSDIGLGNVVNTSDTATPTKDSTDKFTAGGAYTELNKKVDKVDGYILSQNDFTDDLKTKLDGIGAGSNVKSVNSKTGAVLLTGADIPLNTSDTTKVDAVIATKVDKVSGSSLMTDAEHTKLGTVATGAEANVQSDWNVSDTSSDAYIKNKPTIPSVPVQSVNSKTGAVVLTGTDIATSTADVETLDTKSVANMLHLGYYDTYTYDSSTGIYTVTRQTGYAHITSSNLTWGTDSGDYKYICYSREWTASLGISPNATVTNDMAAPVLTNKYKTVSKNAWFNTGNEQSVCIQKDGNYFMIRDTSYSSFDSLVASINILVQYKLATSYTETYDSHHFARSSQPYIEEWKKSEADRSANLCESFSVVNWRVFITAKLKPNTTYTCVCDNKYQLPSLLITQDTTIIQTLWKDNYSNWTDKFTFTTNSSVNGEYAVRCDINKDLPSITKIMLNEGTTALPYQPYEGEVVHQDALAKKLDKGDWREHQFDYTKDTTSQMSISPALENGTYICEILARGTGDYSAITTCYSLGVFSGYGTIKAYVGGKQFAYGATHNLCAYIDNPLVTVRGDLNFLQEGDYTSYIRFRKIADD